MANSNQALTTDPSLLLWGHQGVDELQQQLPSDCKGSYLDSRIFSSHLTQRATYKSLQVHKMPYSPVHHQASYAQILLNCTPGRRNSLNPTFLLPDAGHLQLQHKVHSLGLIQLIFLVQMLTQQCSVTGPMRDTQGGLNSLKCKISSGARTRSCYANCVIGHCLMNGEYLING